MLAIAENDDNQPDPLMEVLQVFGHRLAREVDTVIGQRAEIEERWMEDLRRLKGVYEPEIQAKLDADDTRSSAFVNVTRAQCNKAIGRMGDMLFPSDDKNWGISPTPVPELSESVNDQTETEYETVDEETGEARPVTVGELAQEELDELNARAKNMEKQIDDQLTEGKYAIECREVISDAIEVGTGVLKGPFIIGRSRRAWKEVDGVQTLEIIEETTPVPQRVDYWNFYPDMAAANIDEASFVFERHYMSKAEVKKLKKLPGFLGDQIDELLRSDPRESNKTNSRLTELRALGGITSVNDENRYEIWEYHGEIDREELEACGCEFGDDDMQDVYQGIVWFSGSLVLKAVVNPMETEDKPYSVLCWEDDKTSIFGFGIPYQLRNPQGAANAAWRALLENGALSVGSQIVIDDDAVEPVDGKYQFVGKKIWRKKQAARNAPISSIFGTFDIPNRQPELMAILDKALQLVDIETNLPATAPGNDQAPPIMAQGSATGASIWENSSNVEIRRAVKNFDDNITKPTIQRFYDWNMQFNPDETIKGDYSVKARGSSVLLVKEMQAQNLMQLSQFANDPVFGQLIKPEALFRKIVQAFQISADEVVYTDDELETIRQQQAQAEQPPEQQLTPYEAAKLQQEKELFDAKMQEAALERDFKLRIADLNHQAQMMKLSADNNIELTKINAQLRSMDIDRQNKVDEMNMKISTGMQGI